MKQFILSSEPDRNGQIRLEGGDYRYLVRVRRLSPGEYFPARLPNGTAVSVRVCSVDNKGLVGEIVSETVSGAVPGTVPIILFQALPKGEKMDLIVRQAAEGALAEIVPFVSEFSAVTLQPFDKLGAQRPLRGGQDWLPGQKFIRWERIIKEARQQSGSTVATTIRQPVSFDGLLSYWEQIQTQWPSTLGLLFHHVPLTTCNGQVKSGVAKSSLHGYLNSSPDVVVLTIGPEGGFSPAEAERFLAAGFKPFTIEGMILRTETAALYAQAAVRILLLEKDSWQMK